ncbi:MAG: hypothetical protein QNK25_07080 [Desulfobacterales bacterium]|nr:hypothetical protein [Desulfobacterales bacterium]
MKRILLMCLSFFFVLFGVESDGIVAGTKVIDNFAQATEPNVMILLTTGVIGLFIVSRNMFKR